ncbi:hypothetical protein C8J55DRAFT_491423 [Lentinula edodes]|uniref:Uncharacterized protein n=1 Tax=Lentinula lateritia TaxID=40482 RepID=A0A9W9A034_9AGAR|nr:hypothetical protein C8J55DRAFT_491423 [Lentinula edodes]
MSIPKYKIYTQQVQKWLNSFDNAIAKVILERDLPIWSSGLFLFFEYTATSVKVLMKKQENSSKTSSVYPMQSLPPSSKTFAHHIDDFLRPSNYIEPSFSETTTTSWAG